jgi:hypothetical protein
VGVPLGWLFLASKQLFANYKWNCGCVQVTTNTQVTVRIFYFKISNKTKISYCVWELFILISCWFSNGIGSKVTLSCWVGLEVLLWVVLWLSPKAYMHQPTAPMKMSAGKSAIKATFLRLLLTFLETNFPPGYKSGVWYISFDKPEYRLRINN